MSEFTENLKPGDTVIVMSGGVQSIQKVESTTKKKIRLDNGKRFSRKTGHLAGSCVWSFARILEPTQERVDEIHRQELALKLNRHDWHSLTLNQLRQVDEALTKALEEE